MSDSSEGFCVLSDHCSSSLYSFAHFIPISNVYQSFELPNSTAGKYSMNTIKDTRAKTIIISSMTRVFTKSYYGVISYDIPSDPIAFMRSIINEIQQLRSDVSSLLHLPQPSVVIVLPDPINLLTLNKLLRKPNNRNLYEEHNKLF